MIFNCGGQGYVDSAYGSVTEIYGCGIEAGAFTPGDHTDVLGPAFAGASRYKLKISHLLVGILVTACLVSGNTINMSHEMSMIRHA